MRVNATGPICSCMGFADEEVLACIRWRKEELTRGRASVDGAPCALQLSVVFAVKAHKYQLEASGNSLNTEKTSLWEPKERIASPGTIIILLYRLVAFKNPRESHPRQAMR